MRLFAFVVPVLAAVSQVVWGAPPVKTTELARPDISLEEVTPMPPQLMKLLDTMKNEGNMSQEFVELVLEFKELIQIDSQAIEKLRAKHKDRVAKLAAHAAPVIDKLCKEGEKVTAMEVLEIIPEAVYVVWDISKDVVQVIKDTKPKMVQLYQNTSSFVKKAWRTLINGIQWAEEHIFGRKPRANAVEIVLASVRLTRAQGVSS